MVDQGGAPIRKASVTLHLNVNDDLEPRSSGSDPSVELGRRLMTTELRSDGTFVFEGLAPGDGYGLLAVTPDGGAARMTGLELKPGETREVRLQVKPGWAIRGRAVLGTRPCAGARVVSLLQSGDKMQQLNAVTDREGRFDLQPPFPGSLDISVTVESEGGSSFGRLSVDLTDPGMKDVGDIVLGFLGRITGQVLDPTGAPVKGALVAALTRTLQDASSVHVKTDADGRFVIEGLGEGALDISVMPPPGHLDRYEPLNLENANAAAPLTLQFKERKQPESATLAIKIKHPGKTHDSSQVRVTVFGDEGVVLCGGSNGDDVWTRKLEVGKTYWILGSSGTRWGRTAKVTVTPGKNEVELAISEEGMAFAATLVNDATGKPLAKATVLMSQDRTLEKGRVYEMGQVATDDEGRIVLTGLAPDLGVWLLFDIDGFEHKLVHIPVGGIQATPIRLIPKAK